MRYKVWNPDEESEDDAQLVLAIDASDAAETYVAHVMSDSNDTYEVMVADEDGNKYHVEVEVEVSGYDVTYSSWPRKLVQ